ncbi:pentapeptide repeat-containing protein [uncultured Desulfobacter sp.]|uniref:pentapeptide repeat-containing protein n=1 Tax=uncultured Desulfobacter sp. TaxID=240139 RepID=UPI002AAAE33E|nr:pentapeptide repeat-containing protein [uncultured Desulfobacter sp.]
MEFTGSKTTLDPLYWKDRFAEEQYDLLRKCSDSGSSKEWILYRRKNRKLPILLEGANFEELDLSKIDLKNAHLNDASFCRCTLKQTMFMNAALRNTKFDGADLSGAKFTAADIQNARFTSVLAKGVDFTFAKLMYTDFHEADVTGANFDRADLLRAVFHAADLTKSTLKHANIKAITLTESRLYGTRFNAAIVNGRTLIWDCAVDLTTDFTGVGISAARVEPQLCSRFETNIRRRWWMRYIESKKRELGSIRKVGINPLAFLRWGLKYFTILFIELFWWITDYGSSTGRVLKSLLIVSLAFAVLYTLFPSLTSEHVENLSPVLRFVRSFYFSVVTTTTVGFGDICASRTSILSNVVIILHVMIGYMLLGALIVRLGILFQTLPEAEISVPLNSDNSDDKENKNG